MVNKNSIVQTLKCFLFRVVEIAILFIGFKFNEKNIVNVIGIIIEIFQISIYSIIFILLIFSNQQAIDIIKDQCKGIRHALIKCIFRMIFFLAFDGVCGYFAYYMGYKSIAMLISIDILIQIVSLILYIPYIINSDKEDEDTPEKGSEYF